jgi:hypothetical protein
MGELGCSSIFGVKVAFTKWVNIKSKKQSSFNIPELEQRSPWAIEVTGKLWSSLARVPAVAPLTLDCRYRKKTLIQPCRFIAFRYDG